MYPQSLFRVKITKKITFSFHRKLFVFAAIKSALILSGRVFIMRLLVTSLFYLEYILHVHSIKRSLYRFLLTRLD